uniref:Diacylglycerol Oacyltransferase putative n=1 Tax=Albugo laibachii Nc14 TaxID=890382 RepID=F0WHD9_9STRA|nr:diacylglycerol Oacyltransferase putative [Albugo laibachii Nc14]|eukprot:CCA20658.1 diacylglycerol Oacyltransferase putative [Albugo laibachii Nc14]
MVVISFVAFSMFVISEISYPLHHIVSFFHLKFANHWKHDQLHVLMLWITGVLVPGTLILAPRYYQTQIWRILSRSGNQKQIMSKGGNDTSFLAYLCTACVGYLAFLLGILMCASQRISGFCSNTAEVCFTWCSVGNRTPLAVVGFFVEMMLLSSFLSLEGTRVDSKSNTSPINQDKRCVLRLNNYINMLLIAGALLLAYGAEYANYLLRLRNEEQVYAEMSDGPSVSLHSAFYVSSSVGTGVGTLVLSITALFSTYGLGGILSAKDGWRFYQPLMGGAKFVCFQVISWTCFGLGILLQGVYLASILALQLERVVGTMLIAALLFAIAELLMMVSLFLFKGSSAASQNNDRESKVVYSTYNKRLHEIAEDSLGALALGVIVNLQWIPGVLVFLGLTTFTRISTVQVFLHTSEFMIIQSMLLGGRIASISMKKVFRSHQTASRTRLAGVVLLWLPFLLTQSIPAIVTLYHFHYDSEVITFKIFTTVLMYLYQITYREDAATSGRREKISWTKSTNWFIEICARYFKSNIIQTKALSSREQYIFAMHPHGVMALSAAWLPFTEKWRSIFPNIRTRLLTAGVLHSVMFTKDVIQWFGGREVSSDAFIQTLNQKENVLIVPGGQAEMLCQPFGEKIIQIYTRHQGFIRIALQKGVSLVPILSFQESEMLSNIRVTRMQRWFVTNFAFPFPFFPFGRFLLPIPRNVSATFAVGAPIPVQQCDHPTRNDIQRVSDEYYQSISELFESHKVAAGCGDYRIAFV